MNGEFDYTKNNISILIKNLAKGRGSIKERTKEALGLEGDRLTNLTNLQDSQIPSTLLEKWNRIKRFFGDGLWSEAIEKKTEEELSNIVGDICDLNEDLKKY